MQCNAIQYNTVQIYIVPKVRQGRCQAVNHAVYNTYRRQRTLWPLSGIYKKRVRRDTKGWVQEIRTYRADEQSASASRPEPGYRTRQMSLTLVYLKVH